MSDMPALSGLANRDPVQLLISESSYKRDIAQFIEQVDDMSEAEIDNLPILPWRREALKKLKNRHQADEASRRAVVYADQMGGIIDNGPMLGFLARYVGDDIDFKIPRGLSVGLRRGDVFFVTDDMWWLDNIPLGNCPDLSIEIMNHERVTRAEYVDYRTLYDNR